MSVLKRFLQRAYIRAGKKALNALAYLELRRRDYVRLFDARPAGAKPPVWSDLWFLYRNVRRRKPKIILEFGSGCSTIMFAQALAENAAEGAEGYLYSLDADPYWGEATIASLPEHLRGFCEVQITQAVEADYSGTPVWRYAEVPDVAPDFIYLDGPALTVERNVAVDVLDLEGRFKSGFYMVVDGRSKNCNFLDSHFDRKYRKIWRPLLKNTSYELIAGDSGAPA